MAETVITAGDPAAVTLYSELTYAQAIRYTTASKLMAVGLSKDDPSNFVQYFEETSEKNGDTIKYDLIYNPFGPGIAGDSVIAGNEVPLTYDQAALVINQLRQAMLLKGMMSQQRVPFSLRDKARNGLANWFRTMIDYSLMNQAAGNTGATKLPYLNNAINAQNPGDAGAYNYTGMQSPIEPSTDHQIFPAGATTESHRRNGPQVRIQSGHDPGHGGDGAGQPRSSHQAGDYKWPRDRGCDVPGSPAGQRPQKELLAG